MSIQKLSEDIINKIAAGEVVQRPSNAIKELIENSIDAEATALSISIVEGGLRELTVIDNGKGVLLEDFPLLCERFATSKIRSIQDLTHIGSFGFRGEALASLSYVSEVKVTSKTKGRQQAYTASFKDSRMLGIPQPHYLNCGTVITCQNLFNCLQVRRESLRPTDQKRRIIKIVNIFSLHYSWVRFKLVCDNKVQVNTEGIAGPNPEIQLQIFSKINQLPLDSFVKATTNLDSIDLSCIMSKLKMSKSKSICLLVNNRIVQIPQLYSCIDQAYCNLYNSIHYSDITYNVYLSLKMDPKYIDCNVHPTKKTVNIVNCSIFCKQLTDWILGVLKKECRITPFTASVQQTLVFQQRKEGGAKAVTGGRNDAVKERVDSKQMPLRYYLPESERRVQGNQVKQVRVIRRVENPIKQEAEHNLHQGTFLKKNIDEEIQEQIPKPAPKIEQVPLQLPLKPYTRIKQPCSRTREFFRNLTCICCLNTQYLLIQVGTSLKMINLLPFYPSILTTWLLKQRRVFIHKLSSLFNIEEQLNKFSKDTNLRFDSKKYTQTLVENRQLIEEILRIGINADGYVESIAAPMQMVRQKFLPKEISYLLARVAKYLFNCNDQPDYYQLQRYLIEYFTALFEQPFEGYNPINKNHDSFFQNKLIPLMKEKGEFESIDFNKYTAEMLNLKAAYKVFQRC